MKQVSSRRLSVVIPMAIFLLMFGSLVQAQTPEEMGQGRTQSTDTGSTSDDGRIRYVGFAIASLSDDDADMVLGTGYTFYSGSKIPSASSLIFGFESQLTFYPGDTDEGSIWVDDGYGGYFVSYSVSWFGIQGAALVTGSFRPDEYSPFFGLVGAGMSMTKLFVDGNGEDFSPDAEFDFMMSIGGGVDLGEATIEARINIIEDLDFMSLGISFKL